MNVNRKRLLLSLLRVERDLSSLEPAASGLGADAAITLREAINSVRRVAAVVREETP